MADKLRLGSDVKELKIGQSFTNPKASAFHSIRYDFKPASVDINKMATVDVANNHQVTVTVPHLDGAGVQQTVFKGSQRPYTKECVLIIDRATGQITLEKLSSNIQVKKTRSESTKVPPIQQERNSSSGGGSTNDRGSSGSSSNPRPQTPPPMLGQRMSSKTRVTSGGRRKDRQITSTHMLPKHSPLHASPNYPSPNHSNNVASHKSPKRDVVHVNNSNESNHQNNNNALASLPSIMDDYSVPSPQPPPPAVTAPHLSDGENRVDVMSDTSSSSDMDSDSDSDSDHHTKPPPPPPPAQQQNGHSNGARTNLISQHILNEDLCLSESGSDSD